MSLALLLPLGLSALAATLIPVLLHLHRRQEQRPTLFAALRWIRGPARPRRQWRIEHPWLLLLRLLLLLLLALLLAQPVLRGRAQSGPEWVVVAAGVPADLARARIGTTSARWHWLLPGFPPLDAAVPVSDSRVDSASLLRELDADLPPGSLLHVVVAREFDGLDGAAIALSRAVDWQIVDTDAATAAPGTTPAAPAQLIALRSAAADTPALRYLQAVVSAWNHTDRGRYTLDSQGIDAPLPANATWAFWLAPQLSPALLTWVEAGGTALVDGAPLSQAHTLLHDANGVELVREQRHGRGRLIGLRAALDPRVLPEVADSTFPQVVMDAMRGVAAAPTHTLSEAVAPRQVVLDSDAALRPVDGWLSLAIALMFLLERVLAWRLPRVSA